jgi:hypothetical protein
MTPETLEEISAMVRSGFYTKDDLMPIFCEEMYAPGELIPDEVASALDSEFARLAEEQHSWPAVTDCDRLDEAFLAMNSRGVIALQNAGYTQSDGYDDFIQALDESSDKSAIFGYCYYHGQDLERAVRGCGLYLSFGPTDPKTETTKGVEVGRIIQEEISKVGLPVKWDGGFSTRIYIPRLTWQRKFKAQ